MQPSKHTTQQGTIWSAVQKKRDKGHKVRCSASETFYMQLSSTYQSYAKAADTRLGRQAARHSHVPPAG